MSRLIDADKLYMCFLDKIFTKKDWAYYEIEEVIDSSPTVDAEPVNHGHNTEEGVRWFRCSICGWGFNDIFMTDESHIKTFPNYCPNCGAKMDEVEND